jgi:hypothetical protein
MAKRFIEKEGRLNKVEARKRNTWSRETPILEVREQRKQENVIKQGKFKIKTEGWRKTYIKR